MAIRTHRDIHSFSRLCRPLAILLFALLFMPVSARAQGIKGTAGPFHFGGSADERLSEAACAGKLSDVKRALKAGASAQASGTLYDASGSALFLNAICPRGEAIAEGDRVPIAGLLVDAGSAVAQRGAVFFPGAKVPMAPHVAAAYTNRPELLAYLLEKGAPVDEGDGARDGTALHWAAEGSCVKCIPVLLAAGADLERRNKMGLTALFVAAARGDSEMTAALLSYGANPFVKEAMGRSAINEAGSEKVRELLRHAQWRIYGTYGAGVLAVLFLLGIGVLLLKRGEEPAA